MRWGRRSLFDRLAMRQRKYGWRARPRLQASDIGGCDDMSGEAYLTPVRDALGFHFAVRTVVPAQASEVSAAFSFLPPGVGPATVLDLGDYFETEPADRLTALLSDVTVEAIKAAGGNLLLHAGAIARLDGASAVLCGASGSGKSTLTAGLVTAGWAYVTDETVCLDPVTLRITPFRRPLSIKAGSHQVLAHLRPDPTHVGGWVVPPGALKGAPLPEHPLLPELLVFPTYRLGARLEVTALSVGEAAFLAGTDSSRLADSREPLRSLARLARRARSYRVVHGDLDVAVRTVSDLLAAA